MIVGIHIDSMNPKTGETKHTNTCYFTMVAKDDLGKTKEVPGLIIESHDQLKKFVEGKAIKKMSKSKRELLNKGIEYYSDKNFLENCKGEKCLIKFEL